MDGAAANPRSKAAAWAWYQRGSGSVAALASARSEAALATPRRSHRGSPSRFKLEADLLLSTSCAPIQDATDRLEGLHLLTNSCNSSSGYGTIAADLSAPSSTIDSSPCDLVVASSSYGAAAWDCGSALFDSFELVAMSKKLDHAYQLNGAAIEKICPPTEDTAADMQFVTMADEEDDEKEAEEERPLCDNVPRPPSRSSDIVQSLPDQRQSKQAIYDMFCRYNNAGLQGEMSEENNRKPNTMPMSPVARSKIHRRRRLHSLSKAFRQHIAQLTGRAPLMPAQLLPEKGLSLQADASGQLQRQHHHKSTTAELLGGGIKSSGSPFRERPLPPESCGIKVSNRTLRKHYSSDFVHHHHHHHYHHHHHHHHYLFRRHSDEGYGVLPEPLLGADKSLLVAAAGLRNAKLSSLQDYLSLNPKLEGALLDCKRKLKDNNLPASSPNVQFLSPSNLQA